MGNIDDLYRKYAVTVNNGSGCLFQPDKSEYTYVLTAKHNIQNKDKTEIFLKENIIVYRGKEQNPENELKVLDVYPHEDACKDAAILKVDYVDDNINLFHTTCERGDSVAIFGYPSRKRKGKYKTDIVDCNVKRVIEGELIEITPKDVPFTYDANAHKILKGFSGSGVFKEVGDDSDKNILLIGGSFRIG
jgi:hypothetical protein